MILIKNTTIYNKNFSYKINIKYIYKNRNKRMNIFKIFFYLNKNIYFLNNSII